MKTLLADPDYILDETKILKKLEYGWGNPVSASVEFLLESVNYSKEAKLPILECGSGLSTLVVGLIAKKYGNTVWSLENSKSWCKRVQHYLDKYSIDSVKLFHCPLKDYGDFFWYDVPLDALPEVFSLVICDGPTRQQGGRRYGLLSVLNRRFMPGCVILFDDIDSEHERNGIDYWLKELNLTYETKYEKRDPYRPFYIMTVPKNG